MRNTRKQTKQNREVSDLRIANLRAELAREREKVAEWKKRADDQADEVARWNQKYHNRENEHHRTVKAMGEAQTAYLSAIERLVGEIKRLKVGEPSYRWMDHACEKCPGATMVQPGFLCPLHFGEAALASLAPSQSAEKP